jgi:hypothetical protein
MIDKVEERGCFDSTEFTIRDEVRKPPKSKDAEQTHDHPTRRM